jgi:hypothetical protein
MTKIPIHENMFNRYNARLILGCIINAFKTNAKVEKEKK